MKFEKRDGVRSREVLNCYVEYLRVMSGLLLSLALLHWLAWSTVNGACGKQMQHMLGGWLAALGHSQAGQVGGA